MINATDYELGWLAGIIEGEGYISIRNQNNRWPSVAIGVNMTDEDVLCSVLRITGYGKIVGPYKKGTNKPIWTWQSQTRDDVADILYTLLPFMHERRSLKIIEALAVIEDLRDAEAYRLQFYSCGHPRTEENSNHTKNRSPHCRTCKLAWGKTRTRQKVSN